MVSVELLAPARDLSCGRAAIDHGADAVYIGGPSFGARMAAGNSMSDIEHLGTHARRFRAKVYLTLNTILFDEELDSARTLAWQAWDAGVDALIIQDMGLLELDLPPLPLIASTQMHNVDARHVRFLEDVGFQRVILARELSLQQIREIRSRTSIELEAFVHGSLCVSFSGRCSMSAFLGGRSANRGACGQPCRLRWSLVDGEGCLIEKDSHLLSLKDMDRSHYLADLISAGVSAFKIEGRLKDESYVKNITAFYRSRIDSILEGNPDLKRSSSGHTSFSFTPDPTRTFHRGSTAYFLAGGQEDDVWSPDSPKSLGEEIGTVEKTGPAWFTLYRNAEKIHAGDGLCFLDENRELKGLQVVRVTGKRVLAHLTLNGLKPGMVVHRNHDHEFLKQLKSLTSTRKIHLDLTFSETPDGFVLEGRDEDGISAQAAIASSKEEAVKPQAALDTMKKQLSKLNDGIFSLSSLTLRTRPCFLRTSELNMVRRQVVSMIESKRDMAFRQTLRRRSPSPGAVYPERALDFSYNVSNTAARRFYERYGVCTMEPAFEVQKPPCPTVLMTTRHCLRRSLGACLRQKSPAVLKEPLFIETEGHRFRLEFDCGNCRMRVVLDR